MLHAPHYASYFGLVASVAATIKAIRDRKRPRMGELISLDLATTPARSLNPPLPITPVEPRSPENLQ